MIKNPDIDFFCFQEFEKNEETTNLLRTLGFCEAYSVTYLDYSGTKYRLYIATKDRFEYIDSKMRNLGTDNVRCLTLLMKDVRTNVKFTVSCVHLKGGGGPNLTMNQISKLDDHLRAINYQYNAVVGDFNYNLEEGQNYQHLDNKTFLSLPKKIDFTAIGTDGKPKAYDFCLNHGFELYSRNHAMVVFEILIQ
jgi:endonuclease/exonuclease/phosphatase family metal-dependent hydrolase